LCYARYLRLLYRLWRNRNSHLIVALSTEKELAGCPPCQGFSTIRTRKKTVAASDPRNALIGEFIRFVEGSRGERVKIDPKDHASVKLHLVAK
jgi:hypothetical protein